MASMDRRQSDPLVQVKWYPGNPPDDREGQYLVWLSESNLGSRMATLTYMKISNGFLGVINGVFVNELLDDDLYILAWAHVPEGPIINGVEI